MSVLHEELKKYATIENVMDINCIGYIVHFVCSGFDKSLWLGKEEQWQYLLKYIVLNIKYWKWLLNLDFHIGNSIN